ncbi:MULTISPECIES: Dot/Icm T4SS effector Wip [unclassified Legionella]|uniref:Dot/Icm T4SS effector Wip n=1 Tax=unclassified Legionella TaxID=2622702 RepID=UPI001056CE61|nr:MULTISPECIES: Dot/Icm T4SS effector Wip [unclassified Legionella]MDI9818309.1 hypothetical protein [Legionella sp. PL877]
MVLKYREADLNHCPLAIESPCTHISLGDLHGNALKLIYILIEERILQFSSGQYDKLRDIYNTPVEGLSVEKISCFRTIINKAKVDNTKAITLIGDELADRGQNDYFTLFVLKKLYEADVNIEIMLSNHSTEFIKDYERACFTGRYNFFEVQGKSLGNMQILIEKGLVEESEIRRIVTKNYIPMVKAIGYTLSTEGNLTLFSHAPVGLETVKALAEKFNIYYQDNNLKSLIHTINAINQGVLHLLQEKKLAKLIESEGFAVPDHPIPLTQPLFRLLWNRAVGNELITEPSGGFKVRFVHGHIGDWSVLLKNDVDPLPTHQNLDNFFGKGLQFTKTGTMDGLLIKHFTRGSSDLIAKQLTGKKLDELSN